jgi:curli production assembly/transport component CsgG
MKLLKLTTIALALAALTGCSSIRPWNDHINITEAPKVSTTIVKEINTLPAPAGQKIAVAVYSFKDLTGQRKPSATLSSFSTAVTQGAESYLIKSLQEAGNRQWFTVVERSNLDNLLKERQMIKQTREIYEGAEAKMLPPLTLAGVILEGGVIDYNSNVLTGGTGFAILGIGPYTSYTQDQVVISLRLISVQTGEVLSSVTIEKNLLSTQDGATAMRFYDQGTKSFEFDSSQTFNEPGNYALRSAIEQGVVEMVKKGEKLGLWKYKEASNELVQSKTAPEGDTKTPTKATQQSSIRKDAGGNKEESTGIR